MAWPTTKDLSKYAYNQFKGTLSRFHRWDICGKHRLNILRNEKNIELVGPHRQKDDCQWRHVPLSGVVLCTCRRVHRIRNSEQSGERRTQHPGRKDHIFHSRAWFDERIGSIGSAYCQIHKADRPFGEEGCGFWKRREWVGRRCAEGKPSLESELRDCQNAASLRLVYRRSFRGAVDRN